MISFVHLRGQTDPQRPLERITGLGFITQTFGTRVEQAETNRFAPWDNGRRPVLLAVLVYIVSRAHIIAAMQNDKTLLQSYLCFGGEKSVSVFFL